MENMVDGSKSRFSRRRMLLVLGGAVVAAGALVAAPFRATIARRSRGLVAARPWTRRAISLGSAGYDEWAVQVGSVFAIGGGTSMRLTGVRALESGGSRPIRLARDSAFLAVFDPLGGATMAGNLIYTAVHPEHGALMMFLTASSDSRTPARMLAVFN